MRVFWASLDWLLCIVFWIGWLIGLPGLAIAQIAHYLGLLVAAKRGFGR